MTVHLLFEVGGGHPDVFMGAYSSDAEAVAAIDRCLACGSERYFRIMPWTIDSRAGEP